VCGANNESIMHYLLKCTRYSALRISLLSAAAQVCGNSWNLWSDSQKLKLFLFGDVNLNIDDNKKNFNFVQQFIKESERFRQVL
jgi:hypothetical protein